MRGPNPVNAETYEGRKAQAKAMGKAGIWHGGNWTGFGGALNTIHELINPGHLSSDWWDNITGNPLAISRCYAETGDYPDWVALGRMTADGHYIVPTGVVIARDPAKPFSPDPPPKQRRQGKSR